MSKVLEKVPEKAPQPNILFIIIDQQSAADTE